MTTHDAINHPKHYTSHPSGVECITVTEHMGFNLGNAVKYVWRADLKDDAIEDLRKAVWYLEREIARREKATPAPRPAPALRTHAEMRADRAILRRAAELGLVAGDWA